jgi:hypothetical protein
MATHVAVVKVVLRTTQGTLHVPSKVFSAENRNRAKVLADGHVRELSEMLAVCSGGQVVGSVNGALRTLMPVQNLLAFLGVQAVGFTVMEAEATDTEIVAVEKPALIIAKG